MDELIEFINQHVNECTELAKIALERGDREMHHYYAGNIDAAQLILLYASTGEEVSRGTNTDGH